MKKKLVISILIALLLLVVGSGALLYNNFRSSNSPANKELRFSKKEFLRDDSTSNANTDSIKNSPEYAFLDSVSYSSDQATPARGGRKVTIAITGLDSRIGSTTHHADANHVLTFWLDSGVADVVSVPRGSFVDCGYPDSSHNNYLANVRSKYGRERYLKELAKLSGAGNIDYYVEFGFSQAIGLLELLGFKDNSVQMLRVLRSRKTFSIGDYQRAYNQGQFIRQMLLSQFHKFTNIGGDIVVRGGLILAETNLNAGVVKNIIQTMHSKGFPHSPKDVTIRLKPKLSDKMMVFDFVHSSSRDSLYKYVADKSPRADSSAHDIKANDSKRVSERVIKKIKSALSVAYSAKNNHTKVINELGPIFAQKSWYQIADKTQRARYRNEICLLLYKAYSAKGDSMQANKVNELQKAEEQIRITN